MVTYGGRLTRLRIVNVASGSRGIGSNFIFISAHGGPLCITSTMGGNTVTLILGGGTGCGGRVVISSVSGTCFRVSTG